MDDGVPDIIRQRRADASLQDTDPTLHVGLDAAQRITLSPDKKRFDILMEWAREAIDKFGIKMNTSNHEVLLSAAEAFEVTDMVERQAYFRFVFNECMKNSDEEATVDNGKPVFPVQFPANHERKV